jgi:hypothetical protein
MEKESCWLGNSCLQAHGRTKRAYGDGSAQQREREREREREKDPYSNGRFRSLIARSIAPLPPPPPHPLPHLSSLRLHASTISESSHCGRSISPDFYCPYISSPSQLCQPGNKTKARDTSGLTGFHVRSPVPLSLSSCAFLPHT